jgi:SCY1-like protein 1
LVRDHAFKALNLFVKKLEEHACSMVGSPDGLSCSLLICLQPETVNVNESQSGGLAPIPTTLVDSAAGAAGSLAGWAIHNLSKKVRRKNPRDNLINFFFKLSYIDRHCGYAGSN